MSDQTGNTPAVTPPAKAATRVRVFSRVYDFDKGLVTFNAADQSGKAEHFDLSTLPTPVLNAFALGAIADYLASAANSTVKEGGTPEQAFNALTAAFQKAADGKVDFRTGAGGEGASVGITTLVGRALSELGKTFVVAPNGTRLEFSDVKSAGDAMRQLYDMTEKVEGKKVTGRQLFSVIKALPDVSAKLAEYRANAGVAPSMDDVIG